jgi:RNA polymerase sigma-70 factor, ECF subfamily
MMGNRRLRNAVQQGYRSAGCMESHDARAERELVARVARGEEAAAAEFLRRYLDRVFRFICPRVGYHEQDAEEVTQETFLSAVRLAPTFRGESGVFSWLCGIARKQVFYFHSNQRPERRGAPANTVSWDDEEVQLLQSALARGPLEQEIVEQMAVRELVERVLLALPEAEREALLLRYVEDLSVREIAAIMKRTEKAVESLLRRARQRAFAVGSEGEP